MVIRRPAGERPLEELADELHREVLEGERRAVEELEQEVVRADLHEGRAGGMAEAGVGARRCGAELVVGEGRRREGAHDAEGHLLVCEAREGGDFVMRQGRHGLGHVEPAVAGEAGQHGVAEAEHRGLPAGRDVAHGEVLHTCRSLIRHRRNPVIPAQTAARPNHWMA
jgi:hypothetical protein